MLNFLKGSFEKAFGSIIAAIILFVALMFIGSFAFRSVGAMAVPIDRAKVLNGGQACAIAENNDVGMLFILKNMGTSSTPANVSIEVNEISDAKILSGLGSIDPIKNGNKPIVNSRYVRVDGVPLQNNSRADYVVIGKGAGGKISGSILVGDEKATDGVFFTVIQFYFLCGCFFIIGGLASGLIAYFVFITKSKDLIDSVSTLQPTTVPQCVEKSPRTKKSSKKR